jgi:sugar phosphate permease
MDDEPTDTVFKSSRVIAIVAIGLILIVVCGYYTMTSNPTIHQGVTVMIVVSIMGLTVCCVACVLSTANTCMPRKAGDPVQINL